MFEAFRVRVVRERIRGRLLDVGAWSNRWAESVGGTSVNYITEAPPGPYHTITMLAVLNYIATDQIQPTLGGCYEQLDRYGRLVLTCINPLGSLFLPREPAGLSKPDVLRLVEPHGFKLVYDKPFMLGCNRLYVFSKELKKETLEPKDYRKEVDQVKQQI